MASCVTGLAEIMLDHPVKIGGVIHSKLTVASFDAIANFRSNSPEQVILSLSRVFGVPRRSSATPMKRNALAT